MRHHLFACLAALMMTATAGACSQGDDAAVVELTASEDACVVATTDLAAGSTTFRIHNEGDRVTEVYVYAADDRVVSERENIGPGTSADLTADLAAGTYEVACKPGQTGDGIRSTITVTGAGGKALPAGADVEVHFEALEFSYAGLDALDLRSGNTVEFEMTNQGTVEHEFEVFGPDDGVLGEIGPTAVGKEGTLILRLSKPGTYRYVCGIDDHEKQGMAGSFTVE